MPSPDVIAPDTLVHGRYRVLQPIGRGGMGAVYEARDERLNAIVALKQMLVSGDQAERAFLREAQLLASLRHPALPKVSDYFEEQNQLFLVMEYIPGDDLATELGRRGAPFPPEQVREWAEKLLDALDYLHTQAQPIIHRDIKPQNLKLTPRGELILLDFGLAKKSAAQTVAGADSMLAYTPLYAPLEQIRGEGVSPRSDLYSLSATLYHLLTGVAPTDALSRAAAAVDGHPDPLRPAREVNPAVPEPLSDLIEHALALRSADRPADAKLMRRILRGEVPVTKFVANTGATIAVGREQGQVTPPIPAPIPPPSQVHLPPPPGPGTPTNRGLQWGLFIGVVVGLCALVGGAGWFLTNTLVAGRVSTIAVPPVVTTIVERPSLPVPTTPARATEAPDLQATAAAELQATIEAIAGGAIDPSIRATIGAIDPAIGATVDALTGDSDEPDQQPTAAGANAPLLSFGGEGTGPGLFDDARSIAVDPQGFIYVADYSSGRVQRFDPQGTFVKSWQVEGRDPLIFDLATDREGHLYVAVNGRLDKFAAASGELVERLDELQCVVQDLTVLPDGNLLLACGLGSGVFTRAGGESLLLLSASGQEIERYPDAISSISEDIETHLRVAADGQGRWFVLTDSYVYRFRNGTFEDRFALNDDSPFGNLAVDGQSRVYVTAMFGGIDMFDSDGRSLGSIKAGSTIFGMTIADDGYLYILDRNAAKVSKLRINQ